MTVLDPLFFVFIKRFGVKEEHFDVFINAASKIQESIDQCEVCLLEIVTQFDENSSLEETLEEIEEYYRKLHDEICSVPLGIVMKTKKNIQLISELSNLSLKIVEDKINLYRYLIKSSTEFN